MRWLEGLVLVGMRKGWRIEMVDAEREKEV